ncbi:hypothetical protein GCM10022226_61810 [Sphaerisporangium flaviroseum]|uniref:Uncharacterized protein n=1 Tax=Sphaerisporangium flaviroseum TaxID=509199 RepID=A0ABP7J1C0_9ACTN
MTDPTLNPRPTPLPEFRGDVVIDDIQAMEGIHRTLNRPGDWSPDTLDEIRDIVVATGRHLREAADIQVEMLEDLRGWPIAHLQSDELVAYIHEAPDGGLCFDIHTEDDVSGLRVRFLIDGNLVHGPALDASAAPNSDLPQSAVPEDATEQCEDRR